MHVDYWRFGSFDPALIIASTLDGSVRLSWPSATTGWSLQSTAAVPGGWSNENATVTTEGNTKIVTVRPNSAARFYRLAQ